MKAVLPLVFSNSIALIAFSVRASKAEVGSSKLRMSGYFINALAMEMLFFDQWSVLLLVPPLWCYILQAIWL